MQEVRTWGTFSRTAPAARRGRFGDPIPAGIGRCRAEAEVFCGKRIFHTGRGGFGSGGAPHPIPAGTHRKGRKAGYSIAQRSFDFALSTDK